VKKFVIKENASLAQLKKQFDAIAKEKRLRWTVETLVFLVTKNVAKNLIAQIISAKRYVTLENVRIANYCLFQSRHVHVENNL